MYDVDATTCTVNTATYKYKLKSCYSHLPEIIDQLEERKEFDLLLGANVSYCLQFIFFYKFSLVCISL